jgi:hypothetical protein
MRMPGDKKHHSAKFRSCVEKVMAEGKDESSAYAICTASLQEAGEPIFETAEDGEMRHLHLRGAIGKVRIEMLDGREHIVVPVVALMEGVIHAVNADCPEFVPLATLQKAAASWNGKPVTLGHPTKGGKQCTANAPDVLASHGMGRIFNSRVEGTKLLQEAWIDKARAKALNAAMHDRLLTGGSEEVSVGAFVMTDKASGAHNGRPYKASWLDTTGDHLAFLPGGRGACSLEMGCGAHRAAGSNDVVVHLVTAEEFKMQEKKTRSLRERFKALVSSFKTAPTPDELVERYLAMYEDCDACDGTGKVDGEDCDTCHGEGELKVAAGARNSAADLSIIQEMHDRSVSLGATCDGKHSEAYHELTGLEGKSLDERIQAVNRAVDKRWSNGLTGTGTSTVYAYAQMVYDDRVIVRKDDKLWSVPYAVGVDGGIEFGEFTEVRQEYVAAVALPKTKDCAMCAGTGSKDGNPCEACDGTGQLRVAGGPGSGNFGHEGRPGEIGGSAPDGGGSGSSGSSGSSGGSGSSEKPSKAVTRKVGKHADALAEVLDNEGMNWSEEKFAKVSQISKKLDHLHQNAKFGRPFDGDEADKLMTEAKQFIPKRFQRGLEAQTAEELAAEVDRALMEKAAAGDAAFRAACGCREKGMTPEEKAAIIKTLVADKHSGFTAGDEKMLEGASDERLESFRVAAGARANREREITAAQERKLTTAEFMDVAPPELKSLITRQQKQETEMKAALVTELKAAQSEYSEAELSVMPVTELARMARVAKVDAAKYDYSGRGVPRAASADDEESFTPPDPYEAGIKALQSRAVN